MAFEMGNDSMIYSFGGFDASWLNNSYKYNVTTNTWIPLANLPTPVWECTAAKALNGKIYVFGGENGMNLVQIYDPVLDTWSTGTPIPIGVRMHSAITAPNGKVYVIGGWSGSTAVANVQIYDPVANSWTSGAPMSVPRNQFGSTLGPDGKIYIIGGKNSGSNNSGPFYNNVDVYDPATDTWAPGTVLPNTIGETEAVTINGGINLFGGTSGTYLSTNYRMTVLIGMEEPLLSNLGVYPNPASGSVTVSFGLSRDAASELKVFDAQGKLIYYLEREDLKGRVEKQIDLSGLIPGIYFLQLFSDGETAYSKFIVK